MPGRVGFAVPTATRIPDHRGEEANLRWEAEKFRKGSERVAARDYPYSLSYTHPELEESLRSDVRARPTELVCFPHLGAVGERYRRTIQNHWTKTGDTAVLEALAAQHAAVGLHRRQSRGPSPSKDHNFLPGQTVAKQLIVINNSRETVTCDCKWLCVPTEDFASGTGCVGSNTITLPTGEQERIPWFELPAARHPARRLRRTVRFSNGETAERYARRDVLPAPEPDGPTRIGSSIHGEMSSGVGSLESRAQGESDELPTSRLRHAHRRQRRALP